jgi:nickel transport protein
MKARFLFITMFIIIVFPAMALAHRVSVFAYQEGNKITVEGFFSDGNPTKHAKVEAFDKNGKKCFSGQANEKGTLSFEAPKVDTLKIVLRASMGHRAETVFHLKNASAPAAAATTKEEKSAVPVAGVSTAVSGITENQLKTIVHEEVARAIQPVMRTLARQQAEKISFSDIIGGIGWIMGLMGIWMMLKARKK